MKRLRVPALLGTACLVLLGASCAQQDAETSAPRSAPSTASERDSGDAEKSKPKSEKPEGGDQGIELAADPAPDFEVETFDGDTFAIREQLGTPVVLNFWESW